MVASLPQVFFIIRGDNDHLLKVLGYSHGGTYAALDGGRRLSPALASDLDFVLIILIDPCKGRILALSFEGQLVLLLLLNWVLLLLLFLVLFTIGRHPSLGRGGLG